MDMSDEVLSERVRPLADALSADGYDLQVATTDEGRIVARIDATPEACPDCLVPKAIMAAMFSEAIYGGSSEQAQVELRYPGE